MQAHEEEKSWLVNQLFSGAISGIIAMCLFFLVTRNSDTEFHLKEPKASSNIELAHDEHGDPEDVSNAFVIPTEQCMSLDVEWPKLTCHVEDSDNVIYNIFTQDDRKKFISNIDEMKHVSPENILDRIDIDPPGNGAGTTTRVL